ncbi:glutathione S-transferase family protein [Halioxenophilus sp. WMMB6]|uniref:glutathione S-transferase family protein n=1 Tax=Halioxenophilus sp. WMMB6 TaxID=3073815 RepID=UPI00295EAA36|nr:glutathione S-transferase family protein [Halioxenophilus sp. WMMB6]
MPGITLYAYPGSCSKVSMILLEETGVEYAIQPVNLMRGEHKQPAYLAINPKAKVPALKLDEEFLTENPVLIQALAYRFPDAKLMPPAVDTMASLQQWSDLCFCAANLHPLVTRLCKPEFFAGEEAIDNVKEKATLAMHAGLALVEERLANTHWWYGDAWSAVDAYVYWVYARIALCGFDFSEFPHLEGHAKRMGERPAVQKATEKERAILAGYN